ncbi:MAG TPA: tetratricopeptide repeat protein [Terriglobia bacterium]|nr:tetratricopeptide repeat protein [Terriglobia bacterium]
MSLTRMSKWVAYTILFVAVAGTLQSFGQTGGLVGEVKDEKGNVMVGNPILIERSDVKGVYKTKTDKKGHYIYIGLPLGTYKITLQDPNGREIFHFGGVHVGMGDPTVTDFDMAKERAQAVKAQAANPEAQKQIQENEKEQKQFAGLKGLFEQGQALYNDKKYAEAAAVFEQALPMAKDRNLVAVLSRLGDCYGQAHQYDKAVEDYKKAIELSPSDAALHNSLGNIYANMGKIPEAQAEFQKSAEMDPAGAAKAYFNLGATLYNTGKMDEAAEAFKKATEKDPTYADAYALMGRALMGKVTLGPDGKTVVAPPGTVEALETYLKLDPDGKYAAEAKGDLDAIKGGVQTEYKSDKKKKKG